MGRRELRVWGVSGHREGVATSRARLIIYHRLCLRRKTVRMMEYKFRTRLSSRSKLMHSRPYHIRDQERTCMTRYPKESKILVSLSHPAA